MHWNPVFGSDECLLISDELISFHSFEHLENIPLWSQKCPDDLGTSSSLEICEKICP